jgi:pseudaminic acid synthase
MMENIRIGEREIGENKPVLIVAELSANHNHDFDIAVKTIKAAKQVGADAIKLQTYTPDTMTIDVNSQHFKINDEESIWKGMTLYELYQQAYTPWDWQPKLKKIAEDEGLLCFSTPFDRTAVDFLEKMNVPAYKVASLEITDIPLLRYIAEKNKPVIISTGIAQKEDIDLAIKTCKDAGNEKIIILKCVSGYPTPINELNLRTITDMRRDYETPVGISDHSLSIEAPIIAVALGARIIEKHFILDRELGGPDAQFSLDKDEFSTMVKAVRNTEEALGEATYKLSKKMEKGKAQARSLFVVEDIREGEMLTNNNIKSIRPGHGMHPKHHAEVLGRKALVDMKKGTPLSWEVIADR